MDTRSKVRKSWIRHPAEKVVTSKKRYQRDSVQKETQDIVEETLDDLEGVEDAADY